MQLQIKLLMPWKLLLQEHQKNFAILYKNQVLEIYLKALVETKEVKHEIDVISKSIKFFIGKKIGKRNWSVCSCTNHEYQRLWGNKTTLSKIVC